MSSLELMLRELRLGTVVRHAQEVAIRAEREGWSFTRYLHNLVEMELLERGQRRTQKWLKDSGLPTGKTLTTLEVSRLPEPVRRQLPTLCEGHFVERAHNILAFGLPGRGFYPSALRHRPSPHRTGLPGPLYARLQTGATAAHGQARTALGKRVAPPRISAAVILDDIGYLQQNRDEMEVLFTFLAERYERKSVLISSNLVFSQWDRIFKDPMTTAAAIDRLVHHATILELTGPSYRTDKAKEKANEAKPTLTETNPTLEESTNTLSS